PYLSTLSLHDALPIFLGTAIAVLVLAPGGVSRSARRSCEGRCRGGNGRSRTAGSATARASWRGILGKHRLAVHAVRLGTRHWMRSEEHTSELQSRFDI